MYNFFIFFNNNIGDNMLIYITIFISKIIENTLSTLRLIVVSNGKKKLGAILNGIIALIWIFVTSIVIVNINKDPIKIIAFSIGSIVGSYLGSLLEEKLAMGSNLLMCIINKEHETSIKNKLSSYKITTICEKDNNFIILLIFIKRSKIKYITNIIKSIDNNSIIFSEKAKNLL